MPLYRYRAVDLQGNPVEDTMEAPSAHRVVAVLQERGLHVSTVEEANPPPGLLRVSRQLTWQELHLFITQLGAIVKSGLPLASALQSLAKDLRRSRLKGAIDRLRIDIEHGVPLDEAIARQPRVFPHLFSTAIRAGEAGGNLPGVLQLLARYTGRVLQLRGSIQMALTYPATVLVAATCIMAFLLIKVVPVYAEIFNDFGGELPAPTRLLVALSSLVTFHAGILLAAIVAAVLGIALLWRIAMRTDRGRVVCDWIRTHAPIVGTVNRVVALSRFCRSLGLLLASRVPILESLELAAASSGSAILERAVAEANLMVASGERLADALDSTGFFGHTFCWMVSTAENRGEVEIALESLAETYEREVALRDRLAVAFVAPALIFVVGGVIAFFVFSMYLPIFTLGDSISGL